VFVASLVLNSCVLCTCSASVREENSRLRRQLAGDELPTVPVAIELRDHTDAQVQEIQAVAQQTIASLKVRPAAVDVLRID
jgi:hypothetical protein